MKTNHLKTLSGVFLVSALLTSCISYDHSYRIAEAEKEHAFNIIGKPVADLKVDINKKVQGTSEKHGSIKKAKDEAYYNAIVNNNIHVVIDPIYKVRTVRSFFGQRSSAEIVGYAGYYENVRVEKGDAGSKSENNGSKEQELFDMRFKNLQKLSSINLMSSEEKNSYLIDSRGECCEGSGDKGKGKFGEVHLLHTAKNTDNILLDEYFRMVNKNDEVSSRKSGEMGFAKKGFFKNLLSKGK